MNCNTVCRKILLETEFGQTNCIGAVVDQKNLKIIHLLYRLDILTLDGDFINGKATDAVLSFKKYYLEIFMILIGSGYENIKKMTKIYADLFINKKSSSAKDLNSLMDLVKKRIG